MTCIVSFALAASMLTSTAHAGDAEITLKFATVAPLAASLYDADPDGQWIAAPAEPMAARTKADILMESLENTAGEAELVVSYDPALLRDAVFASSVDGRIQVHAVGDVTLKRGLGGAVEGARGDERAEIVAPATATWEDLAFDHVGYLAVDPVGNAFFVFPPADWGLTGVEHDDIN